LDGVEFGFQQAGLKSTTEPFSMGRLHSGSTYYYTSAKVDEAAVWNKALSATEIQASYAA